MNSFLLTIGFVLVLALSALFAAPLFVDWNDYKHVFEEQATAVVGRPVKIEGAIEARILPAPELRLHDVVIAGEAGKFETPLARIETLTAELAPGALLQGAFQAQDIKLESPAIHLALDETGQGAWTGLGGKTRPRFLTGFSIDQITIADGKLEFVDAGSGQESGLTGIDGVLVVRELAGPYRFTGKVAHEGQRRELRFSTARAEPGGRVPLKAVIDDIDGAMIYTLDGALTDWRAAPAFEGAFTARAKGPADPNETAEAAAPAGGAPFEAQAKIDATMAVVSFEELEVTLRDKGRSQTLKGSASVDLTGEPSVKGELAARFVDADVLFAASDKDKLTPYLALSRAASALLEHRDRANVERLSVTVEQLQAGGDLLRDVRFTFGTSDEGIRIDELAMAGPGGSVLSASGGVSGAVDAPAFAGPVDLKGAQLDTLLRWLARDPAQAPRTEVGAFELFGNVQASDDHIQIAALKGSLDGAAFSGALNYRPGSAETRGSLELTLASDRLDLNRALADAVTLDELLDTPPEQREQPEAEAEAPARALGLLGLIAGVDAEVEIAFGAVALPGMAEGPLDAQFSYRDGTLEISRLSFNAGETLSVQGQGRISDLTSAPSGKVDFALKAANAEAADLLVSALGLPAWFSEEKRLPVLAPLDLVVGLEARRENNASTVSLSIAGSAAATNVSVNGTFAGRFDAFAEGKIDAEATLTNPDARQIVRLLMPAVTEEQVGRVSASEGVLRLKLDGSPGQGMKSLASLTSGALDFRFEGMARWSDSWLSLDGSVASSAPDAGVALALVELPARPDPATPFDLRGAVSTDAGLYKLGEITGTIAGERISGTATVDLRAEHPAIDADLIVSRASLPALLSLSVAWDRNPATENIIGDLTGSNESVWPSKAFALEEVAIDLDLALEAASLNLFEDAAAKDAHVELTLQPGVMRLTKLEGELFEGKLSASGHLSAKDAGAALESSVNLTDAQLAPLGAAIAGRVVAEGPVGLSFTVQGEGLSPSGLVAGLSGKGQVAVGDGLLRNLNADPLREVAAKASKREGAEQPAGDLLRGLGPRLTQGAFDFKPASIPFELKAGTVRITDANLTTEDARADFRAYVELVSLKLDSEWNVRLSSDDARLAAMPPVNLVVAGPLAEAESLNATVTTAAVEQYITMRRMEADVEQLENLDVGGGAPDERSEAPVEEKQPEPDAQAAPVPEDAVRDAPSLAPVSAPQAAEAAEPQSEQVAPVAVEPPMPLDNPRRAARSREPQPAPVEAAVAPVVPPVEAAVAPEPPEAPEAAPPVDAPPAAVAREEPAAPETGGEQLPWLTESNVQPQNDAARPVVEAPRPAQRRVRRRPRPRNDEIDVFRRFGGAF